MRCKPFSIITIMEDGKQCTPSQMVRPQHAQQQIILNLIDQTRRSVATLDEEERFERAKIHLEDALKYRQPRVDRFDTTQHCIFHLSYCVQTNIIWETLVQVMSFCYMYLLLFEGSDQDWIYRYGSIFGLFLFWMDLLFYSLHSSCDTSNKKSLFAINFRIKVGLLIILIAELIMLEVSVTNSAGRPFLLLRFFRGILPIAYVSQVRRSFEALLSAYQPFLVFLVFQIVVVLIFALVGSTLITVPSGTATDSFTNNYQSLSKMIFIVYVTGSYDAFPDNQLLAFTISQWFQIFFLLFVFLNMFLFSSIPGSLLFDSYIDTRSKYILLDQIKMQHSLILAFVSLGQNNYEINIQTIINFLNYLYDNEPSAVDAVTQLCLRINDDGNCSVHVLEFIRIGRIWQESPYLKPSPFCYYPSIKAAKEKIASFLPSCSCLKPQVVSVILGFFALVGAVQGIGCIFSDSEWLLIADKVISCLLLVDIILRVASEGLEQYFSGEWNTLDFVLILVCITSSLALRLHSLSGLFKLVRLFRVFSIIKSLCQSDCLSFQMLQKFKRLVGTVIIIVPLAARFIPLFLVTYYVLGIAGTEVFYDLSRKATTTPSIYDPLSNFRGLINTQFYLVQVLTEAGWSAVAFDYANRAGQNWTLALLFFVMCHLIIVLVLAAVLKGIIWFVFLTVAQQLDAEERIEKIEEVKKNEMALKVNNIMEVEQRIKTTSLFHYDTLTKRILFEAKADSLILQQVASKLKQCPDKLAIPNVKRVQSKHYAHQKDDDESEAQEEVNNEQRLDFPVLQIPAQLQATGNSFLFTMIQGCQGESPSIYAKEEVQEQDIEQYMNKLLKTFKINTTRFEYQIENCNLLKKHLKSKLFAPYLRESKQTNLLESNHISCEQFNQKKTLQFHIFTLHLILNMETKRYTQKSLVLKELINQQQIDEYQSKALMTRKLAESSFQVDQDSIIRQMYLQQSNQPFIDKFQAEYFGDIFGPSFKEINKVTIQPLIHLESTLTYALKKLARSPHISHLEFFKILGQIESNISNRLLKKGSLFKIVYEVKTSKPSWFTIQYTSLNETKVSFLKRGIWLDDDHLLENEIYYGKDIFKVGKQLDDEELLNKGACMKKLYESYESLALTIPKNDAFFESNPTFHQYDTYLTHTNVQSVQRITPRKLQIGKIMAVMLTKEQEREGTDPLPYPISDIHINPPQDLIDFKIDEAEDGTYLKLGRLFDLNDDEITANEGLPFAYVLNFLCEISDTLKLYGPSFVHQAQKVLNETLQAQKA